jgi:hypothetical protein
VPMAASQYPATATPAGDRMTGQMIAMGCLPPTGDGLSSAGLGEESGASAAGMPGWPVLNPVKVVTVAASRQAAPAPARRRQP